MKKTLLTGLILLLPSTALAQAQGGPDTPKPDDKAGDTAKPDAAKPEEASAGGPAGPGAATDSQASGEAAKASTTGELSANLSVPPEGPKKSSVAAPPPMVTRRGQAGDSAEESAWKFDYHGYLRAPMRVGVGKRLPEDTNGYTIDNQSTTTLHEASIPDDQYLSFQSTGHNMRSWAESFFSYGNALATGVVGFGSYNLTEGGFNDFRANWGISQAYVLLTPDLGYENVRIWAKAGAIVDKYGMAGRYDAGEYDMYMFGRTHVIGETFHVDYDVNDAWTLYLEQGFGTHKADPNAYNNARYTLLHHEHIGLKKGRDIEFGAHYLMSWSQEEYRPTDPVDGVSQVDGATRNGLPNGRLWVTGVDARAELGAFGYIYGGYSHVGADYALTVSRAIEVLHASGGGEFDLGVTSNYLDSPSCHLAKNPPIINPPGTPAPPPHWTPLDPDGCSDGNGSMDALQAHYEFSLTNFQQQISGGQRFWGRGFDAILKLYGVMILVDSKAMDTTKASKTGGLLGLNDSPKGYKVTKSKFGADLTIQALPWLSPGIRFDRVVPNDHIAEQGFAVLSPRLQFKSQWVTHERITLGYSRYLYDRRICEPRIHDTDFGGTKPDVRVDPLAGARCTQAPPSPVPYDGFGTTPGKQDKVTRATGVTRPDENVFKVEATMWW